MALVAGGGDELMLMSPTLHERDATEIVVRGGSFRTYKRAAAAPSALAPRPPPSAFQSEPLRDMKPLCPAAPPRARSSQRGQFPARAMWVKSRMDNASACSDYDVCASPAPVPRLKCCATPSARMSDEETWCGSTPSTAYGSTTSTYGSETSTFSLPQIGDRVDSAVLHQALLMNAWKPGFGPEQKPRSPRDSPDSDEEDAMAKWRRRKQERKSKMFQAAYGNILRATHEQLYDPSVADA